MIAKEVDRKWMFQNGDGSVLLKLSPVDMSIPNCYISTCWVYKTQFQSIQRSLYESLRFLLQRDFEPLSGCFSSESSDSVIRGQSGALWVQSECNELKLSDFELGNPSSKALTQYKLFQIPATTITNGQQIPVLAIQVTSFFDGSCIAVSIHHRVADGCSLVHLMHCWSFISNSQTLLTPLPLEMKPHFNRDFILVEASRSIQQQNLIQQNHQTTSSSNAAGMDMSLFAGMKILYENFTKTELLKLKNLASSNSTNELQWISTRDALFAHIWRCLVISGASHIKPDDILHASVTINARQRDQEFPLNFIGNASLVSAAICQGGKQELLTETIKETAQRIRKTINGMDINGIRNRLFVMSRKSAGNGSVFTGFKIGVDVTSSDWSAFDWFNGITFEGNGTDTTTTNNSNNSNNKPVFVVPARTISLPGLVVIVRNPIGLIEVDQSFDHGLSVYIHVTASQAEYLEKTHLLHQI